MLLKMKLNIGVVDRGTNLRRDSLASRATLIFINARAKAMRNYASQLALVARPSRRLVDRPTFIVQRSESSSLLRIRCVDWRTIDQRCAIVRGDKFLTAN